MTRHRCGAVRSARTAGWRSGATPSRFRAGPLVGLAAALFVSGATPGPALGAGLSAAPAEAPAEVTAGQRGVRPFDRFELDRLSELATQVVAGVVEETESSWSHDRSRILTRVTLRVELLLGGQAGDTVVFQVPGGRVGNLASVPSHTPEFRVGEEVLVFLRGAGGRLPSVLGGTFGKVPLAREPGGALRLLFPIEPGVDAAAGPLTRLDELRESVRGYRAAARR